MPATSPDPTELLDLGTRVATRAADLLLAALDEVRTDVGTKSTGTDMVTEMDRAAEELIVAGILRERPEDGVVGEEGTDRAGTSRVRWIVDPLDGTTNYLYRHPGFNVSVAAAIDDVVVAGVVVDPVHAQTFTATIGGGAAVDGTPISHSGATSLDRALVGTGFGYDPDRRRQQAEVLVGVLPRVRDVRRMGAAAVDLCSVACGRLDAYYEIGLAPWDLAAGALIAIEAGASVTDLEGGPPSGAFVVAAAPAIADPLRRLLREAGAVAGDGT
jgi:myo-inositol-1(or 4)-monophosphatase